MPLLILMGQLIAGAAELEMNWKAAMQTYLAKQHCRYVSLAIDESYDIGYCIGYLFFSPP